MKQKGIKPPINFILSSSGDVSQLEISHKVQLFMQIYKPSRTFIKEISVLHGILLMEFEVDNTIVFIQHIQEVIDGILYEEYLPETINDLKTIENEITKNQNQQQ